MKDSGSKLFPTHALFHKNVLQVSLLNIAKTELIPISFAQKMECCHVNPSNLDSGMSRQHKRSHVSS